MYSGYILKSNLKQKAPAWKRRDFWNGLIKTGKVMLFFPESKYFKSFFTYPGPSKRQ